MFSCNKNVKKKIKLEVWEDIRDAANNNDIGYLLNISKDTLTCVECNEGESTIEKEKFYRKYINQLYQNKNYKVFTDTLDTSIKYRIIYDKHNKGNSYSMIYTILKNEKSIKFLGVESIP